MNIENIGVIGAGLMGRGIAHVAALGCFNVVLQDVSDDALKSAVSVIERNMQKGVDIGKLAQSDKDRAVQKISVTTDFAKMADCTLIIEAVPEDLKIKFSVLEKLDQICPPETILATNTSALSITEIASATKRPNRVIGMHFFNPVHVMKLVEIIKGLETSEETAKVAEQVAQAMGKETVFINEFPGFVTTRVNAVIGNEAFNMLMDGVGTPEHIDKAIKLGLNHPMGPFEMVDLVGLDTRLKILQYLHESLGEKYRPCPLHVKYVKAGRLGRKSGKGIYEYDQDGRRK